MRIVETKVYKYHELSDEAKATAREWFRRGMDCSDYAEFVTDDFRTTLKAFGFDATDSRGRDSISWSGFSSQGDGASFSGQWHASKFAPEALLADRPATYGEPVQTSKENAELHRIAGELRACVDAGAKFALIDAQTRWGFHMRLEELEWSDEGDEKPTAEETDLDAFEERFITACRDLAHGFYRALEAEYDYQNSDEQIAESIDANEYEFTAEGKPA